MNESHTLAHLRTRISSLEDSLRNTVRRAHHLERELEHLSSVLVSKEEQLAKYSEENSRFESELIELRLVCRSIGKMIGHSSSPSSLCNHLERYLRAATALRKSHRTSTSTPTSL